MCCARREGRRTSRWCVGWEVDQSVIRNVLRACDGALEVAAEMTGGVVRIGLMMCRVA